MNYKKCMTCGEHFLGEGAYCSIRCKEEHERIKKKVKNIGKRTVKHELTTQLAITNDRARACGMSYGQYVAWQKSETERKKRLEKKNGKIG